jgi:hypothetical protein
MARGWATKWRPVPLMFVDKDELIDDNCYQFMEEELGFEDLTSKSGGSLPFKMTWFIQILFS